MNCGKEVSGEFVVSCGNSPEILEPAEGSLDDVAAFVSPFVEAVDHHPVRFIGNDGLGSKIEYLGAEAIAIITFVGDERAHRWRERQNARTGSDVGVLARCEMKCKRAAERIAQRVDFRRAPAA